MHCYHTLVSMLSRHLLRSTAALLCLAVAMLWATPAASAAGWGTVKGKLVLQGDLPQPQKIVPTQDTAFCGTKDLVVEEVVVGEGGGLANVLVFIRVPRNKKLDVHPDYAADEKAVVPMDNKDCRFDGHITLLRVGQTLEVKNSDPMPHNTNIAGLGFNQVIPAGGSLDLGPQQISKAFRLPSQVSCNIHPWMKSWLMVRDDPYMAASDKNGEFEIANVPAGTHEFQLWQEKSGYLGNVTGGGVKFDKRGRADIEVTDGGTVDLGEIKVPAALFKK